MREREIVGVRDNEIGSKLMSARKTDINLERKRQRKC